MRPRASIDAVGRGAARVALVLSLGAGALGAQGATAQEGALYLLVPVGAEAAGQGTAGAASRLGPAGLWWNPASLAWATRREATADYVKNIAGDGSSVAATIPLGAAGVVSAGFVYFNYGDQAATDLGGSTVGTLYSRATIAALSYSATFGRRFAAGVTWKIAQQGLTCSGACPLDDTYSVSTNAFDFGVQGVLRPDSSVTVAATLTNVGFCMQVKDAPQCDPLPARFHLGTEVRLDRYLGGTPDVRLSATGEVITNTSLGTPAIHLGASLGAKIGPATWAFLRGGVMAGDDGPKAVVGIGIRQGTLGFDFGRAFGGLSSDAGVPPTFASIRFTLP